MDDKLGLRPDRNIHYKGFIIKLYKRKNTRSYYVFKNTVYHFKSPNLREAKTRINKILYFRALKGNV